MTTLAPASALVLPIRALAYDDDEGFIVERAPNPPTLAAQRFRTEAAPIAARIADQVRVARDLMAGAALDVGARAAVGQGLQRVVVELRELAESYDIAPVADVCRAREAGAATLDPRAVAGVEHVAHGLLAAALEPTPAPASEPAPAVPLRPPTGPALVELLEHGITGIERWPGTPLDMPAVPPVAIGPDVAPGSDGVVAIDLLCYRGRAALDRARVVRDELRATPAAPDPDLLAELYDLLDLAALD